MFLSGKRDFFEILLLVVSILVILVLLRIFRKMLKLDWV